jgi:hypothetical protein
MADTMRSLRTDLDRAFTRIRSLEEIAFRQNPSEAKEALETLDAIRDFLRKVAEPSQISPIAANFVTERLPLDWRMLTKRHGHHVVFPLIALNYNIIDARRKLG